MTPVVARVSNSCAATVGLRVISRSSPGIVIGPACRVVGACGRADPAVRDLDLERVPVEVPDRPVALDHRPVDQRVGAVGVSDEREREVGAVVEVDGEPVPAATTDRDEVAPLVVEPGRSLDGQRPAIEIEMARRGHRGPRVVVRAAGRPEVDPPVVVMEGGRLRGREHQVEPEPTGRTGQRRFVRRELRVQLVGAAAAGHRPGRPPGRLRARRIGARDRQVEPERDAGVVARGVIDGRTHLQPLAVEEAVAGLVGDRQVRDPRRREEAALGAEDHELEAVAAAVVGTQVARVVPPLGEPVVRAVVAWQDHGEWIGDGDRRRSPRRHRGSCRDRVGKDRRKTSGSDKGMVFVKQFLSDPSPMSKLKNFITSTSSLGFRRYSCKMYTINRNNWKSCTTSY